MLESDSEKNGEKNTRERQSRELSALVAAVLFVALVAFIGGYFLGVRHGARTCVYTHQEEMVEAVSEESGAPVISEETVTVQPVPVPVTGPAPVPQVSVPEETRALPTEQRFWAIAATVGSYARATQLMEQAATVNIVVRIKKFVRVLPKGKKRVLYQLVTPRYSSAQELAHALQTLKTLPVWSKFISTPVQKDAHA